MRISNPTPASATDAMKRAARLVARHRLVAPVGVAPDGPREATGHAAARACAEAGGGVMMPGWTVGAFQRSGQGRYVHFEHRTAVLRPDGLLVDPNLRAGEAAAFLPDPDRPHDAERAIGWNDIMVASFPVDEGERRHKPWTVLWIAWLGGQQLSEPDARYARWRRVADDAEAHAFVREQGLAPDLYALAFLTNVGIV